MEKPFCTEKDFSLSHIVKIKIIWYFRNFAVNLIFSKHTENLVMTRSFSMFEEKTKT